MADSAPFTSTTLHEIKDWFTHLYDVFNGSQVDPRSYSPSDSGPLISFTPPTEYEEVERYWVDVPFAFVSINYDPAEHEHLYFVIEPELNEWEVALLDTLVDDLRHTLIHRRSVDEGNEESVLKAELAELLENYGVVVTPRTFHKILYYLHRRFKGFGRIEPVMRDPYIEDISCDGHDVPLFVYHKTYQDMKTNIEFSETDLDDYVVRIAQRSGQSINIAEPITDARLPDGSRCELSLSDEVTPHGSAFTIRKYEEEPMTPISLMDYGTFSLQQMAYLWLAIENNKSLIFAGGTASGKTTSMNAISMFIPPRSKVLTIEDTQEIRLHHENWLSAVTREDVGDTADIGMYDLLRSSLRHRPEYIIVGEVRGEEAITLFQAMNTGHTTYSTMHADSVQMVINRLENEPINVPRAMIQSLDILSIQRISHIGGNRVRRTQTIGEILDVDQRTGDLDYMNVFQWDPTEDRFQDDSEQSHLLEQIRKEHGWSKTDLRRELRNRRQVLKYAREKNVTDYQRFTAIVREYYSNPNAVLERIDREADGVSTPVA